MDLVEDWMAFCSGALDVDKSHFLTLFHADHERSVLVDIFGYFPSADLLVERMEKFQLAKKARKDGLIETCSNSKITDLAKAEMSAKAGILSEMGEDELAQLAEQNPVLLTSDREAFEQCSRSDWPNGEKHVVISDYVGENWAITDKSTFALFEAFYGAANSYDIQYFLAAPLIDANVSFDPYFELWAIGSDIALDKTNIVVFVPTTRPVVA